MKLTISSVLAFLVSCTMLLQLFALPINAQEDDASGQLSADKRPKYMDTRRDLSYFKDLLLFALSELADEGKINANVLLDPSNKPTFDAADKRGGRHLGICVQITPSGSYVPRPCWKRQDE